MVYKEEDYLQISGLMHFLVCRRRWALVHIEGLWEDNVHTIKGNIFHERVHDASKREWRGDILTARDLRVFSPSLGISGACDAVEFHLDEAGVPLAGEEGRFQPYPVEYKSGALRIDHANHVQLCAQAMCLEEMLCCDVPEGAIFYGKPRRRQKIVLTAALREEVRTALEEMHELYQRRHTPEVRKTKACNGCSMIEQCMPKLAKRPTVASYIQANLKE
ncbi:MAG: CRISPR-associated protein Cas4 [Peptococcaceae bacterium]|nr:CRISPR-associated protein Cas4 [Peptococcaceae bacterium]